MRTTSTGLTSLSAGSSASGAGRAARPALEPTRTTETRKKHGRIVLRSHGRASRRDVVTKLTSKFGGQFTRESVTSPTKIGLVATIAARSRPYRPE